jgi:hypothetical protein
LILHQFKIGSFLRCKFYVCALLNNPALIENHNLIGMFNGAEPMGNHDDRSVGKKFLHIVHDGPLIIGVQGVGGLIEKQKLRILINRPCDKNTLMLPLADAVALGPDFRIKPQW